MSPFWRRPAASRPCLRAALLWSIPALLAGLILRVVLLHHNPFAYWSEDSDSYVKFAWKLFHEHTWELDRKRRWLYPIGLAFTYLLPGAMLRWVSILQHLAMLGGVVAFGYTLRKICVGWKWLIIPGTLLFALHPSFLYYGSQTLAEGPFIVAIAATFAGWAAWTLNPGREQQRRFSRFLFFFVPFACVVLLKPSGRLFWPGLLAALVVSGQWRRLGVPHAVALLALLIVTPTVGKDSQGVRLLYTSAFPLTRLDTALHAKYKAEIAPLVLEARSDLRGFAAEDSKFKDFLEHPGQAQAERPLWSDLDDRSQSDLREEIYRDLAWEGLRHRPDLAIFLVAEKIVASHVKGLKEDRLTGTFYAERMGDDYLYPALSQERPELLRRLYGVPAGPLPNLAWFEQRVSPGLDDGIGVWLSDYAEDYSHALKLVKRRSASGRHVQDLPTVMGIVALAGLLLSATGRYRATAGTFSLLSLSYLAGVFAIGSANARFLVPVEPWVLLLLVLPLDWLFRLGRRKGESPAAR